MEVHVDASEDGIGLWFYDVQSKAQWQCVFEYPEQLKRLVRDGPAHSTAREALGYLVVVRFIEQYPQLRALAENKSVLVINDNQSAVRSAGHLAARDPFSFIYCLWAHLLAEQLGFELVFQWCRRSEGGMPEADALSKPVDIGNMGIAKAVVHELAASFGVTVAVDLMAAPDTAVTTRYWSRYLTLDCEAVDFLASYSEGIAMQNGEVAWIYPPFHLLNHACVAISRAKVNCLLVHPRDRSGTSQMKSKSAYLLLPVQATKRIRLSPGDGKLYRGRGVPAEMDIYPKCGYLVVSHIVF
jgi:hypothetical protein